MASSSSIRAKINSKEKELSTWKKRKSKLETVKQRLDKDFDDDVSDARAYNDSVVEALSDGLSGRALNVASFCSAVEAEKEPQVWSDGKLSAADLSIGKEISRCGTKISDLEAEIRRLEVELEAAQEREWRARLATLGL